MPSMPMLHHCWHHNSHHNSHHLGIWGCRHLSMQLHRWHDHEGCTADAAGRGWVGFSKCDLFYSRPPFVVVTIAIFNIVTANPRGSFKKDHFFTLDRHVCTTLRLHCWYCSCSGFHHCWYHLEGCTADSAWNVIFFCTPYPLATAASAVATSQCKHSE